MRQKLTIVLMGALAAALLCACGGPLFRSAEELYAQPQLPERYKALSETIRTVMSTVDGEQIVPLSGSNTATIQLVDLDGDRVEEAAVAFFRSNASDDPQPLKIFIFQTGSSGAYEAAYMLQGEGSNVNSIAYEDLNGDGAKEVLVSWQLTSRANVLSVYALHQREADEWVHTTYNESYALADLDGDGVRELTIIQRDDTGEDHSKANWYLYQNETLMLASAANLSDNVTDVAAVRSGTLLGRVPALYVTSECEGGRVTDIFAYRDGGLVNVTLDPDSRVSKSTLRARTDVNVTDIDGDGVLEIPVSEVMPNVDPESTATYWLTHWRQFDQFGKASTVSVTYHSTSTDGWYLILPSEWDGKIAVERNDANSYRGERAVVFYHQEQDGSMVRFMTIYRLTGDNRLSWANRGNRQLMRTTTTTAYSVELFPGGWDCGLTEEQIKERFRFITTEWSST